MKEEIEHLHDKARQEILQASDVNALEQLRIQYLGKKGEITQWLKQIGQLTAEERPKLGALINEVKKDLQATIETQRERLETHALDQRLAQEKCDVTLPGRRQRLGSLHPISRVRNRVETLCHRMGFETAQGPEIEDDYHNFEALNTPPYHPARAMQATFYFQNGAMLRTHTSTVQIRVMTQRQPPIHVIAPGRVYRRDLDPTHTPMFHQVEGLWVDERVTFADLKGFVIEFFQKFFEQSLQVRFRPSYFPFTEPSAEVDIECLHCQGDSCSVCGGQGWLEAMGCGMVDPNVFEAVKIDPKVYKGFAFGLGLDRLALLRYGISDLRVLFENDSQMLEQFVQGGA